MATNEMTWINYSGVLTNVKLNKQFRRVAQPLMKFAQFIDYKEAFGKNAGEAVNWPKVGNLGSYGGDLTETSLMHESTPNITWGTATVWERGLSVPWTFKSETLSQLDIEDILRSGLVDDSAKVLDGLVEREFADTPLKYEATATNAGALVTNGTATATNTGLITAYHVRQMAFHLKKRNVPGYMKLGGRYAGIFSVAAADNLRADITTGLSTAGLPNILANDVGVKILLQGHLGSLHGVEMVEDSFASMFNYNPTARTAASKVANTTGRSTRTFTQATQWTSATECYESYVFGSPAVREVVAVPVEIRKKIATDYGRSKGIAWYALLGYQLEWTNADGEANCRVIHFTAR